eukprot:scaffold3649_cov108-Isochrysis_galbana.AAC.4
MGDPAMYPEIRAARNIYALQRLPSDFSADVQARKQWVPPAAGPPRSRRPASAGNFVFALGRAWRLGKGLG